MTTNGPLQSHYPNLESQPRRSPKSPLHLRNLDFHFRVLNRKFFRNRVDSSASWDWDLRQSGVKVFKVTYGYYRPDGNSIHLNPILSKPWVPIKFLRSVLYHEMLHAVIPPKVYCDGRVVYHHAGFKKAEANFPSMDYWKDWSKRFGWMFRHPELADRIFQRRLKSGK